MLKLQYTAAAETDLNDLSESGFAAHGKVAMIRYNRLIRVTVESLCENPEAIGSKEVMKGIKMFHLRHLRKKYLMRELRLKARHIIFASVLLITKS